MEAQAIKERIRVKAFVDDSWFDEPLDESGKQLGERLANANEKLANICTVKHRVANHEIIRELLMNLDSATNGNVLVALWLAKEIVFKQHDMDLDLLLNSEFWTKENSD